VNWEEGARGKRVGRKEEVNWKEGERGKRVGRKEELTYHRRGKVSGE
jgi:hypothetical protein